MKQMLLRLTDELHAAFREKAHRANRTVNDICIEILEAGLEEDERPPTFTRRWEWSGYTIRPGKRGWIMESWSAVQGDRSGIKLLIPYGKNWPEGADLHCLINEITLLGEYIAEFGGTTPGTRVLRTGHLVS